MPNSLFHVYRNTPFGRETLLQSIYFTRIAGLELYIYIPKDRKFLIYFKHNAVQVELDSSYLKDPDTAIDHVEKIVDQRISYHLFEPPEYSASNLPDIPCNFAFMCSPRIIADLSSKISLGKIGSKVRTILMNANFPILIPSQVFKEWKNITVMFGGSINGIKCLQLGCRLASISGLPLYMFTQKEKGSLEDYRKIIDQRKLGHQVDQYLNEWFFFEKGDFSNNLFQIPHDSLIVIGAFGHGLVKDVFLGSTVEAVQRIMPNSLLLVGPKFQFHPWYTR